MFAKICYLHLLPPLLSDESEFQFGKLHTFGPNHNIEVGEQGAFSELFFAKILIPGL